LFKRGGLGRPSFFWCAWKGARYPLSHHANALRPGLRRDRPAANRYDHDMTAITPPLPLVRLKTERKSNHPWIFQKMVEKPEPKPRPGSVVEIYDREGTWVRRGFYNGHSRITLRVLTERPDEVIDDDFFRAASAKPSSCAATSSSSTTVTDAYRVVHSEGDDFSRDSWSIVSQTRWSSSTSRPACGSSATWCGARSTRVSELDHVLVRRGARRQAGKLRLQRAEPAAAGDDHRTWSEVQASPRGQKHKTGFFCDQRDNRKRLADFPSRQARVLDLCCNSGGFAVYAKALLAPRKWSRSISTSKIIEVAKHNARAQQGQVRFIHADIFPWLRDAANNGEEFDTVILDPAKMTRDREQVIPALKKYLDMNKLALGVVKPGGILRDLLLHRPGQRRTIPRHDSSRRVLRESPGADPRSARRRRRPSLAGARAGFALPQGGVLRLALRNGPVKRGERGGRGKMPVRSSG
jgi:23S rRNA (cytosine1962-C5)-methyltransferase